MRCEGFCTPVIIYFFFAVLSISLGLFRKGKYDDKLFIMLRQIIVSLFWGGLMYVLCYNCHEGWAWFILLFGVIIGVVLLFVIAVILERTLNIKK